MSKNKKGNKSCPSNCPSGQNNMPDTKTPNNK